MITLVFRAYNDGVAFKYIVPQQAGIKEPELVNENTAFVFNADHTAWMAEYKSYATHQEEEFFPKKISSINNKNIIGLPFTIEIDKDTYAAITEANLRNWAGMYLGPAIKEEGKIILHTRMSPLPGQSETGTKVKTSVGQSSPWRVVMLANSPGKLVESEIILNLPEPNQIGDTSWIKPGMCAWDHWWSGGVKMDTRTLKEYISLASEMGFPYQLIDWQWYGPFDKPEADITKVNPNVDMSEVLRFAKDKGVKCWLWLYWTDADKKYEEAFALYEKWGIAGIKIDFMARDDQEMVNWYEKIIRAAAKYHLLINFHGAYKNTGLERTFPNLMTREGVLGNEYNGWSTRVTPEHNVTLPFTRMLAGPMDYTPGGFLNRSKGNFVVGYPTQVMGTRCHELAKFIVYNSPITTVCDNPSNYKGQVGADFLKLVKTTSDDYKVLAGYPGEYIVVARRYGKDWVLAAMTNSHEREVKVNFGFLGNGKYETVSWADAPDAGVNAEHAVKAEGNVDKNSNITIKMAPGGGFVSYYKVSSK